MRNKGFTLVEIVISLVILVAIGLVVGAGLNKVFNKSNSEDKTTLVNRITGSADVYLSNNSALVSELYSTKGYLIIKVNDLINEGLLDDNLIDPDNGEKIGTTGSKDFVMVTLDANGVLKFLYNPSEIKEGYLEAQTKTIEYTTSANSYICNNLSTYINTYETEWGTPALRLINSDGTVYAGSISDIIIGVSCNVVTNKPGSYKITYTYKLPDTQVTKTYDRTVVVSPNMNDIVSLSATVTPTRVVVNGTISFTVTAKNRKNETKTLTSSEYTISNKSTTTAGTFTPTITYNGTANSDGTKPTTTVTYTVIDSIGTIIEEDPNCIRQADNSCWYIGNQSGNYLSYSGKIWRIYERLSNGSLRIILNTNATTKVFSSYTQDYYCNPSSCCNSGHGLNRSTSYYMLSQNPNGLNTYLTSTFGSSLANSATYLNNTVFHIGQYLNPSAAYVTQKVGLMSYTEYKKIASCSSLSCGSSYLNIGSSWGIANYYSTGVYATTVDVSASGYGRDVSVLKNQSLFVNSAGSLQVADGSYLLTVGSSNKSSSTGTALGVRPVVELSSTVKISRGDGTINNPYVVR